MAKRSRFAWLPASFILFSSLSVGASILDSSISLTKRDPNQNFFINPSIPGPLDDYQEDPLYHVDDTLNITWVTGWPYVDLILCQPALDGSSGQTRLKANFTDRWFVWTVTESDVVVHAGPVGSLFYFQVTPPNAAVPYFNSHYFNVSKVVPGSSPTSIGAPGATPPSSTSSSSSSSKNVSSTASPIETTSSSAANTHQSSSPAQASNNGLGAGSIAAIAISVALVTSALTAVLTWWLCVARRRKRQAERDAAKTKSLSATLSNGSIVDMEISPPVEVPAVDKVGEVEGDRRVAVWEMAVNDKPIELPTWEGRESRLAGDRRRESRSSRRASAAGGLGRNVTRLSLASNTSSFYAPDPEHDSGPVSAVDSTISLPNATRDFPVSPMTPYGPQQQPHYHFRGQHTPRDSHVSSVTSADEERRPARPWDGTEQRGSSISERGGDNDNRRNSQGANWPLR